MHATTGGARRREGNVKRILLGAVGLCFLAALSAGVASADCLDATVACAKLVNGKVDDKGRADVKGKFKAEQCWKQWRCWWCVDGATHAAQCNTQFPACEGSCVACGWSGTGISVPCYDRNGREYYE